MHLVCVTWCALARRALAAAPVSVAVLQPGPYSMALPTTSCLQLCAAPAPSAARASQGATCKPRLLLRLLDASGAGSSSRPSPLPLGLEAPPTATTAIFTTTPILYCASKAQHTTAQPCTAPCAPTPPTSC